jgi:hypothetical protein
MKSLSEIGREYGLSPNDVRAIAEAMGITPIATPTRLRLLTIHDAELLRPQLTRAADARRPESRSIQV